MSVTLNTHNTRLNLRTNDTSHGKYDSRYLALHVQWVSGTNYNVNATLYSIGSNGTNYDIEGLKAVVNGKTIYTYNTVLWTTKVFPAKNGTKSTIINITKTGKVSATLEGCVWYSATSDRLNETRQRGSMYIPYMVKYNKKGGSGTTSTQRKYYGEKLTIQSNKPTKTGYTFKGWNTNSSATAASHQPGGTVTGNKDVTFYAVWAVNSYQYNIGTATGVNTSGSTTNGKKNYGSTITLKAAVSAGYAWSKWKSNNTTLRANITTQNTTFTMPAGGVTMTPVVTKNSYQYNIGTATGVNTSGSTTNGSQTFGNTITLKATLSTGYTWSKWKSSNTSLRANITTQNTTFTMPAGAVTMTPVVTKNSYQFNVSTATGVSTSGSTTNGTYQHGNTITLKATVSTGYAWSKWQSNNTSLVANQTTRNTTFTMPIGNVKMTPVVTVNSYQYNIGTATGVNTSGSTTNGSKNYGSTITLTATVSTGYAWSKWQSNNTSLVANQSTKDTTFTMPAGAIKMTPVVTVNSYQYNIGTATGVNTSGSTTNGSKSYGSTIQLNATLSAGYTWSKWQSNNTSLVANQSTRNTTFTMPAGNVKMTPVVTKNSYQFNTGTVTGVSTSGSTTNGTYQHGNTITLKANVATGYAWSKWQSNNTSLVANITTKDTTFTMPIGSITMTPVVTVNSYQYNIGTATGVNTSGSTTNGSKNYGSTITLKANVAAGYAWSKWKSSNTTLRANITTQNTTFTMPAGAITMTPVVTANSYTVNFNAVGGSVSPTSKTVTYASTYGTLPEPTKEGYAFLGWYTSNSGGTKITSATTVTITQNQTLYAHWDPLGLVRVYNGSGWPLTIPYIYNGTGWQQAMGYVYNNGWSIGI